MKNEMEFKGYARADGSIGTRNYVGILSTVVCANEVVQRIASQVMGVKAFMHHQGCCQTPLDVARVSQTLINLGKSPNLHSVLLVSLGCESVVLEEVVRAIADHGKRVETLTILDVGGAAQSIAQGQLITQDLVREASDVVRVSCPVSSLVLGLKCGSSDTTQGLVTNPALGVASDMVVEAGGTSVLGEVTEFIGAEHLLAQHARNEECAKKILELVNRMERRAKSVGCDMRGGQPTGGNIKGGLTTIEEKSLGAIAKAGSATIEAVYEYGVRPVTKGLVVMDSPGREPEVLTGLAAAGCNIIAFSTGRGAPQGFPFVPVVKITGNERTWRSLRDHMDIYVGTVLEGTETLHEAGKRIFGELLDFASGRLTRAEISGYTDSMDIYVLGPVI
jgi:altronate dehydratase large subunit